MVVVVRYFGGVLLGTSLLRKMYADTAEKVLEISETSQLILCNEISVRCNYKQMGQVKNIISNFNGKILDIAYCDEVNIYFCVKKEFAVLAIQKIENIICSKEKIKIISENYHNMDF